MTLDLGVLRQKMGDRFSENEPLAPFTSYRVGGPARWFAQPTSIEELQLLANVFRSHNNKVIVLGLGSNVIVPDEGVVALVVRMVRWPVELIRVPENSVIASSSVAIQQFLRRTAEWGLGGFAGWVGIPGTIGGVVRMNGGTHVSDTAQVTQWVELFSFGTGCVRKIEGDELLFRYRGQSFISSDDIVIRAQFRGTPGSSSEIRLENESLLARRKATQPITQSSCGSVFKNPPGQKSWQLIDAAGLRGVSIGGAQVSEMHSNFIVNTGRASAADIVALIQLVKDRVKASHGIDLETEVCLLS